MYFYSYKLSSAGNHSCIKMASHGSDTNKVHLLMSFPSFFFLCLSVCLSNKCHLLMSFPSFFFLFCLCTCLSIKQRSFINEFSFVFLALSVCLAPPPPGGGDTPILGQYGYVPPESPAFFGLGRS